MKKEKMQKDEKNNELKKIKERKREVEKAKVE